MSDTATTSPPAAPNAPLTRELVQRAQLKSILERIKEKKPISEREQDLIDEFFEAEESKGKKTKREVAQLINGRVNLTWLGLKLGVTRCAVRKRLKTLSRNGETIPWKDPDALLNLLVATKKSAGRPGKGVPSVALTPTGGDFGTIPLDDGMDGALKRARWTERTLSVAMAEAARDGDALRLTTCSKMYGQQQLILGLQEQAAIKLRLETARYVNKEAFLDTVMAVLGDLRAFLGAMPLRYGREANPTDPLTAQSVLQDIAKDAYGVMTKTLTSIEEAKS